MFEVLFCSLITILPDYLFRKYRQGKTWGKEITFFTMWYELRWGISACAILTVSLVTLIFFYHPTTNHAMPIFRTISILPENGGRVQYVFVKNNQEVKAGDPIFSMFDEEQDANIESARVHIKEIEAEFSTAEAILLTAKSGVEKAQSAYSRSNNEYQRKRKLQLKGQNLISKSEVQRLADTVSIHKAELTTAKSEVNKAQTQIDTILPAKRDSAVSLLEEAEIEENKQTIYARVDGTVKQFFLLPGDYVNPILRPAGILVPSSGDESGRLAVQAGFNQLTAGIISAGTFAEITCLSKPFTIIAMKVTHVQSLISSGQIKSGDTLLDIQDRPKPGSLTVWMEPLYENGLDGIVPGTKCIANAYSDHHDLIASGELGFMQGVYLHMVDAVGVVHALILRIQTLLLPVKILVFSGH
ncbi:MAG: HlyD family secretion protein [Sinobacterium sp.]|nr:HlyD family secretion protein [Sinobacterium sp.]